LATFRNRRAVGVPQHRHYLLFGELALSHRLRAIVGAISAKTNGP